MVNKIKTGLLVATLFLASCQGEISSIPDMPVQIERNIKIYNLGEYPSYLYIPEPTTANDATGFGGILIVHNNLDEYYAFDLACPVEVDRKVRVGKPNQSLICKCDSCGEEYDLSFGLGVPRNKISREGLKRYTVSPPDSYYNLLVTNW